MEKESTNLEQDDMTTYHKNSRKKTAELEMEENQI